MAFKYNNNFIRGIFDRFEPDPIEFEKIHRQVRNYEYAKFYLFIKALIENDLNEQ
jgi:hypothetical protein